MTRVLLTGYSGFIGQALSNRLSAANKQVIPIVRRSGSGIPGAKIVETIGPNTVWTGALEAVEYVVHLAARVHVLSDPGTDALRDFHLVNTEGTLRLARCAARAGVRCFVYLSSIKVNGEMTDGRPFTEDDTPNPQDPYARSKLEAELGLQRIAADTGMETIIVRPPLVYGPGVKANFLRLLNAVDKGFPLPFGSVRNRRSLVGVENLCDFICHVLEHPAAAGEVFLVSDGEDISTSGLIKLLASHLGRKPPLFSCPPGLMNIVASSLGQRKMVERVLCSLQIDSGKARQLLGWTPPLTLDQGLRGTVDWYLQQSRQ